MNRLKIALAAIFVSLRAFAQCDPPPKITGEWINPSTRQLEIFCFWSPLNACPDAVWFRQFARTNDAGELITPWMFPTQLVTRPGYQDTNHVFVWDPKFIAFFAPPNNIISRAVPIDLTHFGNPPQLPTEPPIPDVQPLAFGNITSAGQLVPLEQPKPKPAKQLKRKRKHRTP